VPRHLTAFLSYGAADDLPSYPVVLMHGAAPDDVLAAMHSGLSIQVENSKEAVAVLEHQDCSAEHIAFQLALAEGTWHQTPRKPRDPPSV